MRFPPPSWWLEITGLVLTTLSAGLVFIQPEERGVVISAVAPEGYREQALQPGLNWILPFLENVIGYPISRQTYTMSIAPSEGAVSGDDSIAARTSDGQEVSIDASVIFSVDPEKVVQTPHRMAGAATPTSWCARSHAASSVTPSPSIGWRKSTAPSAPR